MAAWRTSEGRRVTSKSNGQRIEPAEIESSIASLVTDDTSVCVQEYSNTTEDGQSQYLTCFFTHGGQGSKAVRSLLAEHGGESRKLTQSWTDSLRDRLPEYMIPQLFVPIPAMPTTTSAKIDRKQLQGALVELGVDEVIRRYSSTGTAVLAERKK